MQNVNVLRTATINVLSCINRTIHIWCDLQTVPLTCEPMAIYAFACLHTEGESEKTRHIWMVWCLLLLLVALNFQPLTFV